MFAVDLHAHTRFFHGFNARPTVFDPVGAGLLGVVARLRGLDAVALTNHDYYRSFGTGLPAIPGNEITTTHGHVLVVGPDPPERTEPGELHPEEAVTLAHERDCAAIIPHPFRHSTVRKIDAPFDAVECNGKHPGTWDRVERLAAEQDLPVVGGSDAHYPVEAGRTFTRVDAPELTPSAVVAAIRDGRVDLGYRPTAFDHGVSRLYDLVHRGKGHR